MSSSYLLDDAVVIVDAVVDMVDADVDLIDDAASVVDVTWVDDDEGGMEPVRIHTTPSHGICTGE